MNTPQDALLLSIRPEHAQNIFTGTKTVELRRVRPRVSKGYKVLVYVSSPIKALVGGFEVAEVIEDKPKKLWGKVQEYAAITRKQFDEYYIDAVTGYGIMIANVWALDQVVPLEHLRKKLPGFQAPQSYRYLKDAEIRSVGALKVTSFQDTTHVGNNCGCVYS